MSERARTPILNLGAGVQSSVLLLMACSGELEDRGWARPELAIFADTQDEPSDVVEWLPLLRMEAHRAGIPLVEDTAGSIRDDGLAAAAAGARMSNPPLFIRKVDGSAQMITRDCTRDYKVRVMRAVARRHGYSERRPVVGYMGLTTDEVERMKHSDVDWYSLDWPLINMRMSRHDCELWLERHGYPPAPKSACRICPMRKNTAWRKMKLERPDDFAKAVEFDHALRADPGLPGLDGTPYLHKSLQPLDEVDFRNAEDLGQLALCDPGGGCMT